MRFRRDKPYDLSQRERKLVLALISAGKGGACRHWLIQKIYDEEDGGPDMVTNNISVVRQHVNQKLARHGLKIVSEKIVKEKLNWYQRMKRSTELYRPEETREITRGNAPSVRWKFARLDP